MTAGIRIKSLLCDLAAPSVNEVLNLSLTAVYFFLAGVWLPKSELGIYAFCFASTGVLAELLTIGTTPVIVRRIAGQADQPQLIAGNALLQRVVFPLAFVLLIIPFAPLLQGRIQHWGLLVLAFAGSSLAQLAAGVRQCLIARQAFWWATVSCQIGMVAKIVIGLGLVLAGLGAEALLLGAVLGGLLETAAGYMAVAKVFGSWVLPRFDWPAFWPLLKEGFPLMLALLFNQSLNRADWILMGVLATETQTGEYVFAYRVFETCRLPLTVISILLLPKLSQALRSKALTLAQRERLTSLHRLYLAVSLVLPLGMIIAWSPVIDALTYGKYGLVNQQAILILSLSVPCMAGVNVMWNLAMAQCRQKVVLISMIIASLAHLGMDLVLIPRYGGTGAAIATTVPMLLQYLVYVYFMHTAVQITPLVTGWGGILLAAAGGFCVAAASGLPWPPAVLLALLVYLGLTLLLGGVRKLDVLRVLGRIPTPQPATVN